MGLKILITWNSADRIEQRDVNSVHKSLSEAGHDVTTIRRSHLYKKYDELDVDSYDLILMKPWMNAMFGSGGNMPGLKERLKSFKGIIAVMYCDIKMKFSPYILDRHDDTYDKINFFDGLNAVLMYSLHKSVLNDEEAMESIKERTKDFGLDIVPIEWNFLTCSVYDELYKSVDHTVDTKYDRVYFGQFKRNVYNSLKDMEFGNLNDIVIGGIAHKFPNATSVYEKNEEGKNSGRAIEFEEYVPYAKYVVIPYEKIKSEYQFTLRFVESLALMNENAELLFDPMVSDYLKQFTSIETIRSKSKSVIKEIEDFVNEQQYITKHHLS